MIDGGNRVFTLYDADGDGVISRVELRDVVMAIHRLSPHGKSIEVGWCTTAYLFIASTVAKISRHQ